MLHLSVRENSSRREIKRQARRTKERTTQKDREIGEINKWESEDRKTTGRERNGKHVIRIYEKSLSLSGSIVVQHLTKQRYSSKGY